ncbi:NapC/NirT family cytochrome c [Colwelliaceae bacterium 6471]
MKLFSNPRLWKIPSKWYLLGIPVGGFILFFLGIIFWNLFNYSLAVTSTEEFCISCHEMESIAYEEYKQTSHFNPVSGVSASCPDCHVPKPFIPKMIRKIRASTEVWGNIMGTLDTPEKYEQHRAEMAERVWAEMKGNDSRECRDCHDVTRMNFEKQSKRASRKHDPEYMQSKGYTCIDCHKGLAHKLPEEEG